MSKIAFAESGTAYHPETGERIVWGTASDHKLVSKAQAEAYKEREEFKGRQSDFTFTAMDAINEVTAVLTTAQCGYLVLLQCFVNYGDGTLVDSEDIPMSTKDMQTVLQLTRKRQTFYDFLNACLEHDIIRKKTITVTRLIRATISAEPPITRRLSAHIQRWSNVYTGKSGRLTSA
ncbi:hypothetical protein P7H22_10575 [Paenibacillus larvae]|nr:hypothetical protein [Paenibacillus larvae]MDT2236629.1 hypothetical protein [Paenibacillus larvae]MDT2240687.1 hypothetical protein [Paenibacillus larvae]MDT2262381.1 hypothetical protein [Paenibacillus larvae]